MVKLRFKRLGRRNRPSFRLCAMDARTRRDGRAIEELGTYDPRNKDAAKQVALKLDRVQYWLSVGAQPSNTVLRLAQKAGLSVPGHLTRRAEQVRKQRTRQREKDAAKAAARAALLAKAAEEKAAAQAAKAAEAKPAEAAAPPAEPKKD